MHNSNTNRYSQSYTETTPNPASSSEAIGGPPGRRLDRAELRWHKANSVGSPDAISTAGSNLNPNASRYAKDNTFASPDSAGIGESRTL